MMKFSSLSFIALLWIQRHRVRPIDGEVALNGLIFCVGLIVVVFIYKWFSGERIRRR